MYRKKRTLKSAFSLIELLIVVAILGVLAAGLLAAIDPFEQLKKGTDTTKLSIASSLNNSLVQSYISLGASHGLADVEGLQMDTTEGLKIIESLESTGELRKNFPKFAGKNLSSVYLTVKDNGQRIIVCFTPESKAFLSHENAYYSITGEIIEDCSQEACFVCVGSGLPKKPTGGSGTTGASGPTGFSGPYVPPNTSTPIPPTRSVPKKPTGKKGPTPTPASSCILSSPSSLPITDCSKKPNAPPTVYIRSSHCVVKVGEPFTITVSSHSCPGLEGVWWYNSSYVQAYIYHSYPASPTSSTWLTVRHTNPTELSGAFGSYLFTESQNVHNYSFSSTIKIYTPGTYSFGSNARDVLYPIPGEPHQASEGMGLQYVKVQVVTD